MSSMENNNITSKREFFVKEVWRREPEGTSKVLLAQYLVHDLVNTKNQDRDSQSYKCVSQQPELKNKSLQMVLWKSHILFEPWADGDTYCTPGAVLPQRVAQLNQKRVLEAIINHGDKQPIHLQVSIGIDESFIKAHISHLLLFYKPFISRY